MDGAQMPAAGSRAATAGAGAGLDLLVAAHFVFAGRVGGAEHMLYNLLGALGPRCRRLSVLCAAEGNLDRAAATMLRRQAGTRILERGAGPGPRFAAEQRACLAPDLAGDAILFPNYFVPPVTPARLGRVVTVMHDFQYRHFPEHFSRRKRLWLRAVQSLAMRKADRVVAISDFVREDALRLFGRAAERKLTVIPNPISWQRFDAAADSDPPLEQPYVLAVAAQYPHKNLGTLVRGFAGLARAMPEARLVLCGQGFGGLKGVSGSHALAPLVETLGIADRVLMTGYLDDAALARWYRHARVFAFPSLFEGFGMPAVEALGLGLPVLTTRRTALPETTLGLAEYVDDPLRPEEWTERLRAMLDAPDRYRPSPAGIARLRAAYAPDTIAARYVVACGGS